MLGVEGPDIEVLDAVFPVQVVQGSTLAESPAQQTTGISSGPVRIPAEELGLCVGGQGCKSKQVSYFDPRQRPIATRAHATILSRPARSNRSPTSGPRHKAVNRSSSTGALGEPAVGTVMRFGVSTVRPSEDAPALAHRMGQRGVTRVVVTRSEGTLVGLFFAADMTP
jgi:CBS domain-containing protein